MDPLARHFHTPPPGLFSGIGQISEAAALPQPFPDVLHIPFGVGLVRWFPYPRGIGDEPARLAIFEEGACVHRVECVSPGHRGGEVVEDQASGDA